MYDRIFSAKKDCYIFIMSFYNDIMACRHYLVLQNDKEQHLNNYLLIISIIFLTVIEITYPNSVTEHKRLE